MARPRAFDEGDVLDRAMDVFWRQGYEGASMTELTKAMGINSPSVYVAFGSKRGLFDAVLERYRTRRAAHAAWLLAGATAREVAQRTLFGAVEWLTDSNEPRGCLLIQGGLSVGRDTPDIPVELAKRRGNLELILKKRFERAKAEGDLAPSADPAALARYIQIVFLGLCVQAGAGATRAELREAAERALLGWPA
ncbi:TetR/AcrR family transcriptional regulator [Burkholderia sp. L27(2015)]|uniref:TetR/AcrR family transcriptional regulator n=1 Tax=Burkholderia sp. L27(2015) TaxID=1641858 RepID=UPI00131B1A78|nr:TetR/AcrR family transcriptional regulator [Burkholderia sp. L27(2015)]